MRFTLRRLNAASLAEAVPAAYRPQIRALRLTSAVASVAVVPSAVMRVREARRLLARLDGTSLQLPVLVLCNDLTEEARELLAQRQVQIIALRSHGWTEERYENIRVLKGSRVKRPPRA